MRNWRSERHVAFEPTKPRKQRCTTYSALYPSPSGPTHSVEGAENLALLAPWRFVLPPTPAESFVPTSDEERVFLTLDAGHGRTPDERFFLHPLDDMDERVQRKTPYDLIKAAGMLRLLLLDAQPLAVVVNRRHRLKLSFEVLDFRVRHNGNTRAVKSVRVSGETPTWHARLTPRTLGPGGGFDGELGPMVAWKPLSTRK